MLLYIQHSIVKIPVYHAVLFFGISMYILVDFANKSVFSYIVILGLYEFFKFKKQVVQNLF